MGVTRKQGWIDINELVPWEANPRLNDAAVEPVARSIARLGWGAPVVARESDRRIIAGHTRWKAAQFLRRWRPAEPGEAPSPDAPAGWAPRAPEAPWRLPDAPSPGAVPVRLVDIGEADAVAMALADNRLGEIAAWDDAGLASALQALASDATLLDAAGFADRLLVIDEPPPAEPEARPSGGNPRSLRERFVVPPTSVLDARQGYWKIRKDAWMALGIRSELGRAGRLTDNLGTIEDRGRRHGGGGLTLSMSAMVPDYYLQKNAAQARAGRPLKNDEFERDHLVMPEGSSLSSTGTSVFDPVLAELAVRWFSPLGGRILDPFAGGSVRGVVAALLGRRYVGVDLRAEQIDANRANWAEVLAAAGRAEIPLAAEAPAPEWIVGDSLLAVPAVEGPVDLVFTCPPYADLEVYSDDPADLSTMDYPAFLDAYRRIIAASCAKLAEDRFAVIVVGDARDKRGNYYNFVGDTVAAFRDAGLALYNEAALVTPLGSVPMRAARQFRASRKLGKTHQNVLVFVKGDGARASLACGECEVGEAGEGAEHNDLGTPL